MTREDMLALYDLIMCTRSMKKSGSERSSDRFVESLARFQASGASLESIVACENVIDGPGPTLASIKSIVEILESS